MKWNEQNIPAMTGKTVIVTGANSGIGYEAARMLAVKGATVIMAVRTLQKGFDAAEKLCAESPDVQVEVMKLDLADLSSVRKFAADFKAKYNALDLLINNAGVMALPKRHETKDGFEMQFGTNHLGHFALTGLLLDVLKATPGARVVSVSSGAHTFGRVDFDNLNAEKKYSKWRVYGLSKLANLLFTYELQRRLAAAGVDAIATAAHPGYTATNLQQHSGIFSVLNHIMAQDQKMGALPTVYAATADVNGGDYIGPDGFNEMRGHPKKVTSNKRSHDDAVAKRLWDVSEAMTGVEYVF